LGSSYRVNPSTINSSPNPIRRPMLHALVERVDRIELTSPPTWALNNIIRRHESLPLKLIAA
jgi:hypothetical protein